MIDRFRQIIRIQKQSDREYESLEDVKIKIKIEFRLYLRKLQTAPWFFSLLAIAL